MQAVLIREAVVLNNIETDLDILIQVPCEIYSKLSTTGSIYVACQAVFHNTVTCRVLFVGENAGVSVFKEAVSCSVFETNSAVDFNSSLVVHDDLKGDHFIECKAITFKGEECAPHFRVALQKTEPFILPLNANTDIVFAGEVSCATHYQEPLSVVGGVCEQCDEEKPVQTLSGHLGMRYSICYDCATALIRSTAYTASSPRRNPTPWELAHMSEEEKQSFAEKGYVSFEERRPEDPYVTVHQKSVDGVLVRKELTVYDPNQKYLTYDDLERQKCKFTYNGGPLAFALHGTLSAVSFVAWNMAVPFVGPLVAIAGWAASIPFSWKVSKAANNMVNDKILLPRELAARRDLIEGRRRDEQVKDDVFIEVL